MVVAAGMVPLLCGAQAQEARAPRRLPVRAPLLQQPVIGTQSHAEPPKDRLSEMCFVVARFSYFRRPRTSAHDR